MKFFTQEYWQSNKTRQVLLPTFISLAGALIALFPANPSNAVTPSRDSGVFFYIGWRLLHGEIPYRDVWDHKPPLIYFTDAAGLFLTPSSMWGTWFIQIVFLAATIFLLYKTIQENFSSLAAIFGSVILSSGLLAVIRQGNVTEEYALPFQAACFWLVARGLKKGYPLRDTFLIGLLGGIAFYYKQNTIGLWLVYGMILILNRLVIKNPVQLFLDFSVLGAGVLIISGILALYFGQHNALSDFWEQAFQYNFVYIRKGETARDMIRLITKGLLYLKLGNVIYFTIIGWLASLALAWQHRRSWFFTLNPLIFIALIDFPIEVLMIGISGRAILHYYLTLLPAMAVLSGSVVYILFKTFTSLQWLRTSKSKVLFLISLLLVLMFSQIQQVRDYPAYIQDLSYKPYPHNEVITYISQNTNRQDMVLILGAESTVNFLSRRVSPTRYVYQYPLQLLGKRTMVEEFFDQVIQYKPKFIIDTRGRISLDEKLFVPIQKRSDNVKSAVQYLAETYQPVMYFGDWIIYEYYDAP